MAARTATTTRAQPRTGVAAPVGAAIAAALAHSLPRGTQLELHAMRETLGKALYRLSQP